MHEETGTPGSRGCGGSEDYGAGNLFSGDGLSRYFLPEKHRKAYRERRFLKSVVDGGPDGG